MHLISHSTFLPSVQLSSFWGYSFVNFINFHTLWAQNTDHSSLHSINAAAISNCHSHITTQKTTKIKQTKRLKNRVFYIVPSTALAWQINNFYLPSYFQMSVHAGFNACIMHTHTYIHTHIQFVNTYIPYIHTNIVEFTLINMPRNITAMIAVTHNKTKLLLIFFMNKLL